MHVLIAITILNINDAPLIENLIPFTSLKECENRLSDIYGEKETNGKLSCYSRD